MLMFKTPKKSWQTFLTTIEFQCGLISTILIIHVYILFCCLGYAMRYLQLILDAVRSRLCSVWQREQKNEKSRWQVDVVIFILHTRARGAPIIPGEYLSLRSCSCESMSILGLSISTPDGGNISSIWKLGCHLKHNLIILTIFDTWFIVSTKHVFYNQPVQTASASRLSCLVHGRSWTFGSMFCHQS